MHKVGLSINGSGHVVTLRFAADRRFHAVLAIVFRETLDVSKSEGARGCSAAFPEQIRRILSYPSITLHSRDRHRI